MLFCVTSDKQIRAYFKCCQIKTNVQTACESHDLNMDFRSFDDGFKQLCVTYSMQKYGFSDELNYSTFIKMVADDKFCCVFAIKSVDDIQSRHYLNLVLFEEQFYA